MSTALQITVHETSGSIKLSRKLFLGSEYDLTFVGDGIEALDQPSVILYDCQGSAVGQSSGTELKLNTLALAELFDDSKRPQCIHMYVYLDEVVLGTKKVIIAYSPISFEYGDPVDIQGIKELWDSHIDDTANPHSVTCAQIGASETTHNHDMSDLIINAPGGDEYRMGFEFVDGQLTFYFAKEE